MMLPSCVIREIQIKTMKCHYTLTRKTQIQNTHIIKFWQNWAATKPIIHCWWKCKKVQPFWKTICWFLEKINISLPYDPATMLLKSFTQRTCKFVCTHKSAHRCL